jgi:hypothetical protein
LLDNTDIVKNVKPYFILQSVRKNILSQSVNFIIFSDGSSSWFFLNVVSFLYVDFVYIFYLYCVFMDVCFLAYTGESTLF